jgi:hypothetical protein
MILNIDLIKFYHQINNKQFEGLWLNFLNNDKCLFY